MYSIADGWRGKVGSCKINQIRDDLYYPSKRNLLGQNPQMPDCPQLHKLTALHLHGRPDSWSRTLKHLAIVGPFTSSQMTVAWTVSTTEPQSMMDWGVRATVTKLRLMKDWKKTVPPHCALPIGISQPSSDCSYSQWALHLTPSIKMAELSQSSLYKHPTLAKETKPPGFQNT